jgi:uncharacterized RDD family membrane protein YckC
MSDDWDFKFDDDKETENKKAVKKSKITVGDSKKRELGKKVVKDDDFDIPQEKPMKIRLDRASSKRKLRREYVEVEEVDEDDYQISSGDKQLISTAIDYTFTLIIYFTSTPLLKTFIPILNIKEHFVAEVLQLGPYLITFGFFFLYNFFSALFLRKTIGMLLMRQTLLTIDGDVASMFTLWMREIFLKPLSLATILSIFFILDSGRGLCDRLLGTVMTND